MPPKTEGPVSRYINRRISGRITSFIVRHGIPLTPNQMSLIAFAVAAVAALLIARGELLLGGVLVQLSSILDGVDGELARALGRTSRRGAFLDTMLDRYADTIVLAAVSLAALETPWPWADPLAVLAASLLALSGDITVSYIHARGQMDMGVHPATVGPLDSIASRDVRLLLLAVLVAAGQPLVALLAVGLLSHAYALVKFVYIVTRVAEPGVHA